MCRRVTEQRPRFLLVMLLGIGSLGDKAAGQEPPPAQSTGQQEKVGDTDIELSVDSVQALIKQVEAATDLAENVKSELLGLYRQTSDQIGVATNWAAKTAEYQKGCEEAPPLLEDKKKRLAELNALRQAKAMAVNKLEDDLRRQKLANATLQNELKKISANQMELDNTEVLRGVLLSAQLDIARMENKRLSDIIRRLEDAGLELQRQATYRVPSTREAQNLKRRFAKHGESYLRFITTPGIDPTNNVAEQAIRFVVIDRHVTQGSRSEAGQRWLERIWTAIATCAQQGRSVFEFLHQSVLAYFRGSHPPSLVPDTS